MLLYIPGDPAKKYVPIEAEILEGDLTDFASLEKFFAVPEGFETIVLHIASIVTVNPDYNQKVIDVNVGGTKNIVELCKNYGKKGKQTRKTSTYDNIQCL